MFYAWYNQYYKFKTEKQLQITLPELFNHALKMDLACYDDPKFYNDYVWAMDESKKRAITVMHDTSQMLTYLIYIKGDQRYIELYKRAKRLAKKIKLHVNSLLRHGLH